MDPELVGNQGHSLYRQAVEFVTNFNGNAEEKADLFERLTQVIHTRTNGEWGSTRSLTVNGEHIFIGDGGNALIIDTQGQLWRGALRPNQGVGFTTVDGTIRFTVNYNQLRNLSR